MDLDQVALQAKEDLALVAWLVKLDKVDSVQLVLASVVKVELLQALVLQVRLFSLHQTYSSKLAANPKVDILIPRLPHPTIPHHHVHLLELLWFCPLQQTPHLPHTKA